MSSIIISFLLPWTIPVLHEAILPLTLTVNTLFLLLSIHHRQFFSSHYFFSQHNISLAMAFLSQFASNPALIKFLNWFNCQFRSSILAIFCPVHMLSNEHICAASFLRRRFAHLQLVPLFPLSLHTWKSFFFRRQQRSRARLKVKSRYVEIVLD